MYLYRIDQDAEGNLVMGLKRLMEAMSGCQTSQLNTVTVIIEEFSVKAVSLKGNPWRLYGAKRLPPQNATTYLSMKVLRLAKNENIQFF